MEIVYTKSDTGLWVVTAKNSSGQQATAPATWDLSVGIETAKHLFNNGCFDKPYGATQKRRNLIVIENYPDVPAFPIQVKTPLNTSDGFDKFAQAVFVLACASLVVGSFTFGIKFLLGFGSIFILAVFIMALRQK